FLDVGTATPMASRSVLLVRGPGGVYDAQWNDAFNVEALAELNALLNELLAGETAVPDTTATPETIETIVPETTPTPTPDSG
ncbi:MAG: hypothetical protein R3D55_18230, partial [Chloroflexota bacterium]